METDAIGNLARYFSTRGKNIGFRSQFRISARAPYRNRFGHYGGCEINGELAKTPEEK